MNIRLQFENQLEYKSWGPHMLHVSWLFILCTAIVEIIVFILKKFNGGASNTLEYIIVYFFFPVILNSSIMLIVNITSCKLFDKEKYAFQAFIYVFAMSIMCFITALVHNAVPVVYMSFGIPILLALTYVDRRVLLFSYVFNTILYLLFVGILFIAKDIPYIRKPDLMNIATSYAIITICYFIARMTLRQQADLVFRIAHANERINRDSLTGLYNHAAFYEKLDVFINDNHQSGREFSLIILDIDNFKSINDDYGHDTGDQVLLTLVSVINSALEGEDIAFRYGGEEFTVLTKRNFNGDFDLAETMRKTFEKETGADQGLTAVTVSLGVARYDRDRFGARREFFAAADEALYAAKRSGKNKTVIWSEKMGER